MSADNNDTKLDDLCYRIRGLIFKVQNDLGTKFQEKHYSKGLCTLFDSQKIKYKTEVPFILKYNGVELGKFRADIVVEDKILLELKATDYLTNDHTKQTLRYLESLNLPIGYVVNFRIRPIQIKRLINSKASALSAAQSASA